MQIQLHVLDVFEADLVTRGVNVKWGTLDESSSNV